MTYTYTDPYRCALQIRRSTAQDCDVAVNTKGPVDIPATDLPGIVAELHKAAGLPNPLADHPRQHIMQSIVDRRDLVIEPSIRADGAVYFGQSSARGWHIRVEDLPELVGALYKAAGQQPPILLPRLKWHGNALRSSVFNGVSAVRTGKTINILGRIWDATTARGVARMLTELAEAADEEPDPEQVEDLATLIYESGVIEDSVSAAGRGEDLARILLRAGYTRSES